MMRTAGKSGAAGSGAQKLTGTNIEFAHFYNQRVVLETVRLHGPISRAEISGRTSLSAQTISNLVDKLLERGVLALGERRNGRRGQPAVEIDINPGGGYGVGLHLDRDHLTGVLLDLAGASLQTVHREWSFPSPEEAIPAMVETVNALVSEQGLRVSDLWGVGLALPGPLDVRAGSLVNPPNFPGWNGVPIRSLLSERLDTPVFLDTDATAAAVGERWFGRGRDVHDYFYVFFGIGLGGGMILNGKPYRGAFDNAAMFGHLPVEPGGARCGCGGQGCLELSVSLASLYAALHAQGRSAENVTDLVTLLDAQDAAMRDWLERAAQRLVPALITVEHLLSPEAILFGGRLPIPLLDWLLERLDQLLPGVQMRALAHHPLLARASAAEDAAALGAATLPLFEAFTPGQGILSK